MSEQHRSYSEKIEKYKKVLNNFLQNDGTLSGQSKTKLLQLQEDLKLDGRGMALAYSSLGHEKLYNQNLYAATRLFRMAISLYEETPAAHAGLGDILYSQRERKEAIKKLERAKELFLEQNMHSEAEQIDDYLTSIAKNDNWWKKLKIALGLDNNLQNKLQISRQEPSLVYNNNFYNANINNFANQVLDNARQQGVCYK